MLSSILRLKICIFWKIPCLYLLRKCCSVKRIHFPPSILLFSVIIMKKEENHNNCRTCSENDAHLSFHMLMLKLNRSMQKEELKHLTCGVYNQSFCATKILPFSQWICGDWVGLVYALVITVCSSGVHHFQSASQSLNLGSCCLPHLKPVGSSWPTLLLF